METFEEHWKRVSLNNFVVVEGIWMTLLSKMLSAVTFFFREELILSLHESVSSCWFFFPVVMCCLCYK